MDTFLEAEPSNALVSILPRLSEHSGDFPIEGEPSIVLSMAEEKKRMTTFHGILREGEERIERVYQARVADLKESFEARIADLKKGFETRVADLEKGFETRVADLEKGFETRVAGLEVSHSNHVVDLKEQLRETREEGTLRIEERNRRFVDRVRPLIAQAKKAELGVEPKVLEDLLAILDVGATIHRST